MRIVALLKILLFLVALNAILFVCSAADVPATQKPLSANEVVAKRDLKGDTTITKSFDPEPEFYRGPGSSFERDRNKPGDIGGYQRPFTPSGYGPDNRYPPKGGSSYDADRRGGNQDRITSGYFGQSALENDYNDRPPHAYPPPPPPLPYGRPQSIDFPSSYGPTAGSPDKYPPTGYYEPSNGIGFDLYNKGYGGDYGPSYPQPADNHYPGKAELVKSFLLPLAGAALIGITAALIANPLLLHLGAVPIPFGRRRRRRDLNGKTESEGKMLDSHSMAYRGYTRN